MQKILVTFLETDVMVWVLTERKQLEDKTLVDTEAHD